MALNRSFALSALPLEPRVVTIHCGSDRVSRRIPHRRVVVPRSFIFYAPGLESIRVFRMGFGECITPLAGRRPDLCLLFACSAVFALFLLLHFHLLLPGITFGPQQRIIPITRGSGVLLRTPGARRDALIGFGTVRCARGHIGCGKVGICLARDLFYQILF